MNVGHKAQVCRLKTIRKKGTNNKDARHKA